MNVLNNNNNNKIIKQKFVSKLYSWCGEGRNLDKSNI